MQPDYNDSLVFSLKRIASKEITLFFASPIAYLFLASFAVVTLFVFFWGESFFARNISDVRPLFEWMPILLIFLASTLTMRLWSEEQRTGTIEYLMTQPLPLWHFVLGKFIGCLYLLALALLITLPLPITVSIMGDLDWGPVFSGYIAAFLLGAAYLSIGLFVSARSNNQIVSLISAVALCSGFYMVGSQMLTSLVANTPADLLRLIGTGSRFDSITRGVIDLRDLYYYLSIIAVFLVLNIFVLERQRWTQKKTSKTVKQNHQFWYVTTALLTVNLIGGNLWLGQINSLRIDTTEGNQYSVSDATRGYLAQLQEPLLVRGYFSSKTHPLLAPLVPQLRDLIREYEIAGQGRVRSEFIDPTVDTELEKDANQKYGIEPTPFQVADRYQASIVSSYFNVVVQYGDQHEVLGFRDLIEVKSKGPQDIDVMLRNPEHDLTRAIKTVLNSYQSEGNLFDTVKTDLTFNAYISTQEKLPEALATYLEEITLVVNELASSSSGKLTVNFIDPEADNGSVARQIETDYGFKPMATSLFNPDRFYFYLTLTAKEQVVQIPLGDLTKEEFDRNLDAAVKRFAAGFTKNVALVAPEVNPQMARFGMSGPSFRQLEEFMSAELNVNKEDLSDGSVSGNADILLLIAPKDLDEKQLFAVDQFLMQGGTVVAATSPYVSDNRGRTLGITEQRSGLDEWLSHHGIKVEKSLVMDVQNVPFPVPVPRNIGGFQMQELHMLDYPYFIDVRGDGLNSDSLITADLPQATLPWASPIILDEEQHKNRKVTELMRSSEDSWTSTSLSIMPRIDRHGKALYDIPDERASHLLGVVSEGTFASYFAGKDSPLLDSEPAAQTEDVSDTPDTAAEEKLSVSSVIEKSPNSSRIILISSNEFLRDEILQTVGAAAGGQYHQTIQLMQNIVDWSLEDSGLLSIRSRGHFNRTLPPMDTDTQKFWEYANYALAFVALILIALVQKRRKHKVHAKFVEALAQA